MLFNVQDQIDSAKKLISETDDKLKDQKIAEVATYVHHTIELLEGFKEILLNHLDAKFPVGDIHFNLDTGLKVKKSEGRETSEYSDEAFIKTFGVEAYPKVAKIQKSLLTEFFETLPDDLKVQGESVMETTKTSKRGDPKVGISKMTKAELKERTAL